MHATRIDASFPFHIHETADHLQNETREKKVSIINLGSGFPCLGGSGRLGRGDGFRGSGHGSGAGTIGRGGSADRPGDMGLPNKVMVTYLGHVHIPLATF